MPLLYYWRADNYRADLDDGAAYHLNQNAPALHEIEIGDSLWAFTRTHGGRYVLAAELVVHARTFNPPGFRYGRYRAWGSLEHSRYFRADDSAPDFEPIIRGALSLTIKSAVLGQSFQGPGAVRRLTTQDHHILTAFAADLPPESRASVERMLTERELETSLRAADEDDARRVLTLQPAGIAESRGTYLVQQARHRRDRDLVRELQQLYSGRCQVCGWDPADEYGVWLCEGHHIQWLSRGGADAPENLMLVCPNHHAAIHACDAPLDWGETGAALALTFGPRREPLLLNTHLPTTP